MRSCMCVRVTTVVNQSVNICKIMILTLPCHYVNSTDQPHMKCIEISFMLVDINNVCLGIQAIAILLAFRLWCALQDADVRATRALTKQRHPVRVTAKGSNVVLYELKGENVVPQSHVSADCSIGKVRITCSTAHKC